MKLRILLLIIPFGLLSFNHNYCSEYPIPEKSEKLLFYIQRNLNKNTIIYDANFDKNGMLVHDNPINTYWIEYEKNGQKTDLNKIEKIYAYGVKSSKFDKNKNQFQIQLVADEKRIFILKQEDPFKAAIYTKINAKLSKLDHLYIYADNSGFWPTVKYIELFGKDIATGSKNHEKIKHS